MKDVRVGRMMRVGAFFICFFWGYPLSAQLRAKDSKMLERVAKRHIEYHDYKGALVILNFLDSIKPGNPEIIYNKGVCTFFSVDKPSSLLYFLRAQQAQYDNKMLYYYLAKGYQFNYDLEKSIHYYELYLNKLDTLKSDELREHKKTKEIIMQIERSKELLTRKLSVSIEGVGGINSKSAEYAPLSFANDSLLIFTSRRSGGTSSKLARDGLHHEDIYLASKTTNGQWSVPGVIPGISGKHHDASVAMSSDQSTLYVFMANGNGDIFTTTKDWKGTWKKPVPLKEINTRYWEGSIALSPSEDTLFFSSDRPGGFGESDLYLATKDESGKWSNIRNMGPEINTPLDDDAPYMHSDGKTFFFSSKGHDAIGGYDIFLAKILPNQKFGACKNLGFPINTIDDDIYFHLNTDASIGYYTSHRHSNFQIKSIGEKDIFQLKRPNSSPVHFIFKGLVVNDNEHQAVPAVVTLKDLTDNAAPLQKIIVDINSGKFRYDLKFGNQYKLSLEVGDKVYYSQHLFFEYQPEVFENLLEIKVSDIPDYTVKLQDVVANLPDTSNQTALSANKPQMLVLVRKVPYNDTELKQLLTSDRIPVSFRKKLVKQLEENNYIDQPEEGYLTISALEDLPVETSLEPALLKLTSETKKEISRIDLKKKQEQSIAPEPDTAAWKGLSTYEQNLIIRLAKDITGQDGTTRFVMDDVYLSNLRKGEADIFIKLLAAKVKELAGTTSNLSDAELKRNLVKTLDGLGLKSYAQQNALLTLFDREFWGIIHTLETFSFGLNNEETIMFRGSLLWRMNDKPTSGRKLLLADDFGMIYQTVITDAMGKFEFKDIKKGKQYHVMVDDYAISMIGQSRYRIVVEGLVSDDSDARVFYDSLADEEKRILDRIIAKRFIRSVYDKNPITQYEDQQKLERLNNSEKEFVNRIRNYLSATSMTEPQALLNMQTVQQYETMDWELRDGYNRHIAGNIVVSEGDSLFFEKLSQRQKQFVAQLQKNRVAGKTILDNTSLTTDNHAFWQVIDEINTALVDTKIQYVHISGTLIDKSSKPIVGLEVALMDETNEIRFTTVVDSLGNFTLPHVPACKRYKVLVHHPELSGDYKLVNLHIEEGDHDFYESLSLTKKRFIDAIIANNLAEEAFVNNPSMQGQEQELFNRLSAEEKKRISHLRDFLYADTVTVENAELSKEHSMYYMNLSNHERRFVNRAIVLRHRSQLEVKATIIADSTRNVFYASLTARQKQQVETLQKVRKASTYLFAENPMLIVTKTWVLLDTVSMPETIGNKFMVTLKGKVIDGITKQGEPYIPLMLTDQQNRVIKIISADSLGRFTYNDIQMVGKFYLLAEVKRERLTHTNLQVDSLMVLPTNHTDSSSIISFRDRSAVTIYFAFDSYEVTRQAKELLQNLVLSYKDRGRRLVMRIEGHTDVIGTEVYNYQLALKRCHSVFKILRANGIKEETLLVKSYGESQPIHNGKSRSLNRRVEIFVAN